MDRYALSSDDCLVLLAIRKSRTLREAARLLGCDPGGLLRKVQRIASEHDVLKKNQGRWQLTEKGCALVGWTQETILTQKQLLRSEGILRIASTSWFAERVLIPATTALRGQFQNDEIQYSVPPGSFDAALVEGDCDFVVACHPPESPLVAHRRICPERWSLIVPASLLGRRSRKILPADLSSLPFVRHCDLNPAALIPFRNAVKIEAVISADNLIGIRAALLSGHGWSYVPTALVRREVEAGLVVEVEAEGRSDRNVCLWWLRGSAPARRAIAVEQWLRKACAELVK